MFEFWTSAGVNVLQLKSSMGFLICIKGRGVEQSPDCFEANLSIKSNLLLDKQTYCKETPETLSSRGQNVTSFIGEIMKVFSRRMYCSTQSHQTKVERVDLLTYLHLHAKPGSISSIYTWSSLVDLYRPHQ